MYRRVEVPKENLNTVHKPKLVWACRRTSAMIRMYPATHQLIGKHQAGWAGPDDKNIDVQVSLPYGAGPDTGGRILTRDSFHYPLRALESGRKGLSGLVNLCAWVNRAGSVSLTSSTDRCGSPIGEATVRWSLASGGKRRPRPGVRHDLPGDRLASGAALTAFGHHCARCRERRHPGRRDRRSRCPSLRRLIRRDHPEVGVLVLSQFAPQGRGEPLAAPRSRRRRHPG